MLDRRVDLLRGHGHAGHRKIETVEFPCIIGKRRIATQPHVIDDRPHNRIHVFRDFPLGRQKGCELLFEAGREIIKADGQWKSPYGWSKQACDGRRASDQAPAGWRGLKPVSHAPPVSAS